MKERKYILCRLDKTQVNTQQKYIQLLVPLYAKSHPPILHHSFRPIAWILEGAILIRITNFFNANWHFFFWAVFFLPKFKVSAREMTCERNKKTYMEKYPMAKVLIYFFLRLTTQLLSSFWNLLLQRKYTNGALFFVLSVLLQDFYCSQMGKAI